MGNLLIWLSNGQAMNNYSSCIGQATFKLEPAHFNWSCVHKLSLFVVLFITGLILVRRPERRIVSLLNYNETLIYCLYTFV